MAKKRNNITIFQYKLEGNDVPEDKIGAHRLYKNSIFNSVGVSEASYSHLKIQNSVSDSALYSSKNMKESEV